MDQRTFGLGSGKISDDARCLSKIEPGVEPGEADMLLDRCEQIARTGAVVCAVIERDRPAQCDPPTRCHRIDQNFKLLTPDIVERRCEPTWRQFGEAGAQVLATVVDRMIRAQRANGPGAFRVRSGAGDHKSAGALCQLHRHRADRPGGSAHEQRLARLRLQHAVDTAPGGDAG